MSNTGQKSPIEKIKSFAYEKTPDGLKNPTDLQIRLRTAALYAILSVLCILISDWTTVIFLMVMSGITAGEFYYMLRSDAKLPNEMLGIIAAVLYPLSVFLLGVSGALYVSLGLLLALIVWYVFWARARIPDVGISFFGAAYCGMLLASLIIIRTSLPQPWGAILALCVVSSVWANDSFAYLVGRKFGKHKLAPRISPKKSWEGFIAGLIGSAIFWCFTVFIPGVNISIVQALVFGVLSGLMGVLGDLAESRIKRNSGFKDSGIIMPGHGGLLDRCDALFLVAVTSTILLVSSGCIPY